MAVRHFLCHFAMLFSATLRLFCRTASTLTPPHTVCSAIISDMYFVRHFFLSLCNIGFLFWLYFDLAFPNVCICWTFSFYFWYVLPLFYMDGVWSHVPMLSSGVFFVHTFFWAKLNKIFVLKREKKTKWDSIISERESIIGKCEANIDLLGLEVYKIK